MINSLRSAVLNEGLETLGTDEYDYGSLYLGAFQDSGLERVRLPSTLRKIGYRAFKACECLRSISLPDGLEQLGVQCFEKSGLESVRIPLNLKMIEAAVFLDCKNLEEVQFSERLERIGVNAFAGSGV